MNYKIPIHLSIILLTVSLSAATLDFRTQNPINFHSSLDINSNNIDNVSEILRDGTTNLKLNSNGNVEVSQGDLKVSSGEILIPSQFKISDTGVIESRRSDDNLYLDLGSGGTGQLNVRDSGRTNLLVVKEDGEVLVKEGTLNLTNSRITDVNTPQEGTDAANFAWVDSNFVNRSGDTMNGNIDMNGNNITDIRYLNMTSGLEIDGDIDTNSGAIDTDGGNVILRGGYISNDGDNEGLQVNDSGDVNVPSGDIGVSGTTDGVDIDNPGNAIVINSQRYAIADDSIGDGEIGEDAVGDTELNNSQSFDVSGLTTTDLTATGTVSFPNNAISNAELANSSLTVAGNSVSLGSSTAVSINDLSDVDSVSENAGQVLIWDDNNDQYSNAKITSGSGLGSSSGDASYTLDVNTGNGIEINTDDVRVNPEQFAGDGLKETSATSMGVEPDDIAGSYLSDDGGDDLQVNTGSYISGDGSDNIQVNIDNGLQGDGSDNIEVAWGDANDLGNSGGLSDNVVNGDELSDSFCSSSQVLVFDGTNWVCADRDSVGTDSQDLSSENASNPDSIPNVVHKIKITNGSNTAVKDYYEKDTTADEYNNWDWYMDGSSKKSVTSGGTAGIDSGNAISLSYNNGRDIQVDVSASDLAGSELTDNSGALDVNLKTLSSDSSISGSDYDGSNNRDWSVAWEDANDLGSKGGLSDNVVNGDELSDSMCGTDKVLVYDGNNWVCESKSAVGTDDQGLPSVLGNNNQANMSIDMNEKRIKNVPKPQAQGDAVNKSYVDKKAGEADNNATQNLEQVLEEGNGAGDDNINMDSQNIKDAGKIGVGTASPSEDLDVDGSASVSSSGTTMKVENNGDVVITLG